MFVRILLLIIFIAGFPWKNTFAQKPKKDNITCLYGYVDIENEWIIPPIYETASSFSYKNSLAIVQYKGKRGIINNKGDFVVEAVYEKIYDTQLRFDPNFVNGCYLLTKDSLESLFYVPEGIVYKDKPYRFSGFDGIYVVINKNEKYGLFKKDSMVSPFQNTPIFIVGRNEIGLYREDSLNGSGWNIYQKNNRKWLFNTLYTSLIAIDSSHFMVWKGQKSGITDKLGNFTIPIYKKKFCSLWRENSVIIQKDNQYRIYDRNGKLLNNKKYTREGDVVLPIVPLYNYNSPINQYWKVKRHNRYGLINEYGKEVVPCKYTLIRNCGSENIALISGNKFTIVDKLLRPIVSKNFQNFCSAETWMEIGEFRKGGYRNYRVDFLVEVLPDSSVVLYDEDKITMLPKTKKSYYPYGYILNHQGKFGFLSGDLQRAIPPNLDKITGFEPKGGYFTLFKNGKMGISDSSARLVVPLRFKYVDPDHGDYFFAMSGDSLFGILDNNGNYVIKPKHKTISHYNENCNCCWTTKPEWGDRWILVNKEGAQIHTQYYDYPVLFKDFAILSIEGSVGVLDKNLKPLISFQNNYYAIKFENGLFICGKDLLDIYNKEGRLLFSKVKEHIRLSDSATAMNINGNWHFYLHDTICIDTLKNLFTKHIDLSAQLGLNSKLNNGFYPNNKYSSANTIQIDYTDSSIKYHSLINNYLLQQHTNFLTTRTSYEEYWQSEDEKNKGQICNKDNLIYQNNYSEMESFDYFYRTNIDPYSFLTISINSLMDDFIEYTEEEYKGYYEIKKQQALIVDNSLKWLSLEEILAEPIYKPTLNKMLLSRLDSLKRYELPCNNLENLTGLATYYSFTPNGLSFQFSNDDSKAKIVLPYKELLLYFKKSDILKRFERRYWK